MTSDQFFNPGFWYLLLALTAISLPLYVLILWKSWRWAVAFLIFTFSLAAYAAFFSLHNFGGAFGAGMALSCLTVLLLPISLIFLILLRHPFRRKFEDDLRRRRLYVIGGILIVVSQLFPFIGSMTIDSACYRLTRSNAEPIISGVARYHQEHGVYPPDLESLQPEYLSEIPNPGCVWLGTQEYRVQVSFEIQTCNDGTVLLTNESTNGTSIERYNFTVGNWSSISVLDGACSFLR